MAKRPKIGDLVATGRIDHGEVAEGKNVVKTFEPGEVVDLEAGALDRLIACGAVKELKADMPETTSEGSA